MKPVRLALALLLAVLALAAAPTSAYAGGPTSVLLTHPAQSRAAALYYDDPLYAALAAAIGYGQAGADQPPAGVGEDFDSEIRLTWLLHDVQIWRLDRIQVADDGTVWVETALGENETGGSLEASGRWHRPADAAALSLALTRTWPLGRSDGSGSAEPLPTAVPPATPDRPVAQAAARPAGLLAVVGLGGLVIGAAGGLGAVRLRRRARPLRTPRATLTG